MKCQSCGLLDAVVKLEISDGLGTVRFEEWCRKCWKYEVAVTTGYRGEELERMLATTGEQSATP